MTELKTLKRWVIKGIKICETEGDIYFTCDLIKKKITTMITEEDLFKADYDDAIKKGKPILK